ncbi:MAG TPA: glycoside hydrolase family 2 TIM barrel-domain containing protein [Longimicrobiaceae bacterium]|jgi:beta-galactosidase/beta-glucuronidase
MSNLEYGFTRDREEAGAVREFLNPLPRSVVRPDEPELLDGEWKFALDLEDRGLAGRWYLGHRYTDTATWPGSIEAHMAAARDAQQHTPAWQDSVVAWYEREFTVPEGWCTDVGCLVQVTFGACGYETRVWLNGRPLRTVEGEEVHFGEYTSFSYELPPELLRPVNRITVRIADSMDAEIPRGKQQSHVYKRGGIWYQTYTGAVRSVWLEPVQRNRLRSRLDVLSSYRDAFVAFDLTTRIHDPGVYGLKLVVAPRGSEIPTAVTEVELPLEAGEKRQRVTVELPDAEAWSPASPHLYTLVAQLTGPDGGVSQIEAHFGRRTVEARGRSVYLNGEPIYLDGILYQPGTATFEEMGRHMHAMKALGCNLVRVHIAGIDPRIYALADEMGMLLWVEVPSPHSSSQRSRDNHYAELMRMLVHIGSHPSVVIWSLYNEDWGAQDIASNAETRRYVARTYDFMRLNHPQLLVVDNDGWNHVSMEGRLKSDLLTAHLYTPELERWRELLDRLAAGENEGVAVQPLVVGDPFFYCGQVPLVVSEWGGFGFADYGGPDDPEGRAARITAFKKELRQRPIAGDVYTQATSIEDEENGLIDPASGELLVPAGILDSRGG